MSLYSVNSLAILKRIDLNRLSIAKSVIATRAITATSPNSVPNVSSALKNPPKQEKFVSDPYSFLRDLPFWSKIDGKNVARKSSKPLASSPSLTKPDLEHDLSGNIHQTNSYSSTSVRIPRPYDSEPIVPLPPLPSEETFTQDVSQQVYSVENIESNNISPIIQEEVCDKQFFLSHLKSELNIPQNVCEQIYFLHGTALHKNYTKPQDFKLLCSFLKKFFTIAELCHNPVPFSLPYYVLFNRISIFREIGIRKIHPSMTEFSSQVLELTDENFRENFDTVLNQQKCFDSLCNSIGIRASDKEWLNQYIKSNYGPIESLTVANLRRLCIAKYLSVVMKLKFSKVEPWTERYSRSLRDLCMETIKKNIAVLKDELNYSSNMILHNGLLCSCNSTNLNSIILEFKKVVGDAIFTRMVGSPKILKTNVDSLIENFKLLQTKCDNRFLMRSASLLPMQHQRLKALFDEIETNKEIQALNLQVFGLDYLALNKTKIFNRIEQLKQHEIPFKYVPLSMFVSDDYTFNEFILDSTSNPEIRIKFYLEENFGLNYDDVKNRLKPIAQSSTTKYSKQNAKKIIEFLVSMNVPREKIIESIYLILFDYKHVKSAYFYSCARYDQTLHQDPNFFQHVFDYLVHNSELE